MLHDLDYPEFQGSISTVRFLLVVDELFDMLNDRNLVAKGSNHPSQLKTRARWRHACVTSCHA